MGEVGRREVCVEKEAAELSCVESAKVWRAKAAGPVQESEAVAEALSLIIVIEGWMATMMGLAAALGAHM